ncbi:MAG: AGE family epimerase/isomerase, partial [Chloroflexota bacterium]|nr:AGE family epimerase/isomerase [Chloroflexota bacterium]
GEGLLLLRVWEVTRAPRHLGAAVARGEWLRHHAIRDALGCHWLRVLNPGNPRSRSRTAFSAGAAGVGHFLLALYEATADRRWAALTGETADTLLRHAVPDGAGLSWPFTYGGDGSLAPNQWCIGAPGIGWFLAEAAAVLREPRYAAAACAAGRTTYAAGDLRRNPSQCHGLAGAAELFLALYRLTGDSVWLDRAHDFAQRIMGYRTQTPDGDAWQADEPGLTSPDFFCGAAGVGHLFLRLSTPEQPGLPFA